MASIEKGKALNSKYLFGTDAELANRNDTGNNPVLDTPPAFSQTKPGNTDANAAAPVARDRSGNLKFGKGV
jgi:hypothetical protein